MLKVTPAFSKRSEKFAKPNVNIIIFYFSLSAKKLQVQPCWDVCPPLLSFDRTS